MNGKIKKIADYILNRKHFKKVVILVIVLFILLSLVTSYLFLVSYTINTKYFKYNKEKLSIEKLIEWFGGKK